MTECLDYLARDERCELTEDQRKHIMSLPQNKGRIPLKVVTVVRINGGTIMHYEQLGSVVSKYDLRYAAIREILRRLDKVEVPDNECETPCDKRETAEDVEPDSPFWKGIHDKHMSIDGGKIEEAPYKYDLNVSVYANGYLVYNGWMVFGSSAPTTKGEIPQFMYSMLMDGVSDSTERPTNEDLDKIFGE